MANEQREQEHPLEQIPIAYWLLLAVFLAGLYIVVLMNIDASRAKVLHFRFTSDAQMMNLASRDGLFKKPSPFGKPVRRSAAYRTAKQDLKKPLQQTS